MTVHAGAALATGDLDGDGLADLIVGAPKGYASEQGVAYVALGPITGDLQLGISANVFSLYGYSRDDELAATLLCEDLDGDGADDLLLGAPAAEGGRGAAYLVRGPLGRTDQRIDDVEAGHYVVSTSGLDLGARVASAGDVDGDGQTDLLFGAPDFTPFNGVAFLSTELPSGELNLGADFRASFVNHDRDGFTGFAQTVAGVGDVDGDGYDDVLLAAPEEEQDNLRRAGAAWLIPGDTLRRANAEPVDHQTEASASFIGDAPELRLGVAAHGPGDLTGDGRAELMLGATYLEDGGREVGGMLLYEGPLSGALTADDASFRFVGVTSRTDLGAALGDLGDLDGYGLPELTIAAPGGNGAVYILPADGL